MMIMEGEGEREWEGERRKDLMEGWKGQQERSMNDQDNYTQLLDLENISSEDGEYNNTEQMMQNCRW